MIIETGMILSFATWLGNKIADKGFDTLYSKLTTDKKFDKTFTKCINKVANALEKKYPNILGNSISYFFTQENVFDELCKLLFVNQEVNIEIISETFYESSLPDDFILEFISELRLVLASEPMFQELLANKELYIAIKGISKDLNELTKNSTLSYEEIREIKRILQIKFKSKFNLESFLEIYKKNLLTNLGSLNFIGLGIDPSIKKGKRKNLNKIFVKPLFQIKCKYFIEQEKIKKIKYISEKVNYDEEIIISYKNLFDRPYNFVILGNPGSGKSLLIKSIICDIASNKINNFSNKRITSYIPFRVELKGYLSYKRINGGNILKYLSYILEEDYSIPSILEDNLSEIFRKEKTIVFFDGLDEIFNASDKIKIKNDIENFHNLFPKTRSLTTSRFIGYNEAKLDEEKFCEVYIKSFNRDQIIEYVNKWYLLEEDNKEIRNNEINDFISKMDNIDRELISNPLLLSLIVILFRNNLKIPESKLDIYQSCTNTLVDKWDASKNLDLKVDQKILQKKEPIFSDLAFWQYEMLSSRNTNITYHLAKNTVASSLEKKNVADEYNSAQLAEDFLNYAQKRSIYFDNNFTHKTFLEYYTAYWIYSNIEKKHNVKKRNEILTKYISNPFWFIVLELLLNMIDKDQPDNEIIDQIFTSQIKQNNSLPFLIYVLPNINNISIKTTINIYAKAIKYLISTSKINKNKKEIYNRIARNLTLKDQSTIINKAFLSITEKERNLNFYILVNELYSSPVNKNTSNLTISEIIKPKQYKSFIEKSPYLYQIDLSFNNEKEYIENNYLNKTLEYIKLFGEKEIFKIHSAKYDNFSFGEFIGFFFYMQLLEKNIYNIRNNLSVLNEKSDSLSLLKYIIKSEFFFKPNLNSLNYLCNLIEKDTTTDKEKLFFSIIVRQGISNRFMLREKDEIQIEKLNTTAKLKTLFHKIKRLNAAKYIKIISNEFNFTDEEVLQLTLCISNGG